MVQISRQSQSAIDSAQQRGANDDAIPSERPEADARHEIQERLHHDQRREEREDEADRDLERRVRRRSRP